MEARKWSAKWRNWNISEIFFSLSSKEGQKQRRWPETFALYMETMLLEDHFDISNTPHSGRPLGFDDDSLNTLIHNDLCQCTGELANVMNCDHSTTVHAICIQGSKIGCMGTACSKPKPQKLTGGHMCISACSSSIGS